MTRRSLLVLASLCLLVTSAHMAEGVTLRPGDIVITDFPVGVIRVDPVTGAQTLVASGGRLRAPAGVALAPSGDLFVGENLDQFGAGGPQAIVRVDSTTGAQAIVSEFGPFDSLRSVIIDGSGNLLVAQGDSEVNGIIRVDPATGARTVVASGGGFLDPVGLTVDPNGDLFVADQEANAVFKVNPITGAHVIITSGGYLVAPIGIAIAGSTLFVTVEPTNTVIRVDPSTGAQSLVTAGGFLNHPFGLAVDASGQLIVANGVGSAGIVRVDPATGIQTSISANGLFAHPAFVTIVPPAFTVPIDVKPGVLPNNINPRSHGAISVAILSTPTFGAAAAVDPGTVRFGPTGTEAAPLRWSAQDVDGDGRPDLVLSFATEDTGIACGQQVARLTGQTAPGFVIRGSDSVQTVGCK